MHDTVSGLMLAVDVARSDARPDFTNFALRLGLKSVRIKFTYEEVDSICDTVRRFLLLRGRSDIAFQMRLRHYLRCVRRTQRLARAHLEKRNGALTALLNRWCGAERRKKEHLHETLRQRMRAQAGRAADDPHRVPQHNVTDEQLLHALQSAITPRDAKVASIMELYAWARLSYDQQFLRWERDNAKKKGRRNKVGFSQLYRRGGDALQEAVRYATLKRAVLLAQSEEQQEMYALENAARAHSDGLDFCSPQAQEDPFDAVDRPEPMPEFLFHPTVSEMRQYSQRVISRRQRERLESRKSEIIRSIETRIEHDREEGGTGRQGRRESEAQRRRSSVGGRRLSTLAGAPLSPSAAAPRAAAAEEEEEEGPMVWSLTKLFAAGFPFGEQPPSSAAVSADARPSISRPLSASPRRRVSVSDDAEQSRRRASASEDAEPQRERRASVDSTSGRPSPTASPLSSAARRPRSAPGRRPSASGGEESPQRRRSRQSDAGLPPWHPDKASEAVPGPLSPASATQLGSASPSPGRIRPKDRRSDADRPASPLSPTRARVSFSGSPAPARSPSGAGTLPSALHNRADPRLRPAAAPAAGPLGPVRERGHPTAPPESFDPPASPPPRSPGSLRKRPSLAGLSPTAQAGGPPTPQPRAPGGLFGRKR
eukprot:TRINITY_DN2802_c3_g2_i1.p1 TRINITY_DN2802_c3_g2~~TRINITY_DN2802_c3_g2_i1.p1  ORF type:complete len:683 (+),score=217.04 TRINITY_DN2802_c3_g2_i1:87-2051(+)